MGYILNNHELGVYILCNPLTVGFVFETGTLHITALFVITNIHKSHNVGSCIPQLFTSQQSF